MSIDPHVALQSLMAALEEHLTAASQRRGDEDPAVEAAYLAVADAFEVYEEVLYEAFGEVTPLEIYEDEEDAFDGDDDGFDDGTGGFAEDDGIEGFEADGEETGNRSSGIQQGT